MSITEAQEKTTPDSSKSTTDKFSDNITGAGDKVAREFQSDESKSTTQALGDKFGREKDKEVHGGTGDSMLDKTKHALGMDKH